MPFGRKRSDENKGNNASRDVKLRSATELRESADRARIYQRLNAIQNFRLVELLPGNTIDPIQCRLKLASLAEKPLYTAISYRCGNEASRNAVTLNGCTLTVRPNLFDLLVQLRHQVHRQTLWIDALCINQFDSVERSSQVRLMANIFTTAVEVIACLRDNGVRDEKGIEPSQSYLGSISDCFSTNFSERVLLLDDREAIALAFFRHEYWRRRWIVQEIALAQSVTIFCGGKTMPLARIKTMAKEWGHEDSLALQLCRLQESDNQVKSTLPELLNTYRATECEDFRDKVFALLSLAEGADKAFHVSYDMTRVELLVATVEFSSAHQRLDPKSTIRFALTFGKEIGMSEADYPKPNMMGRLIEWNRHTRPIASLIFLRANVLSTSLPPELHEYVCRWRDCLDPLTGGPRLRFYMSNAGLPPTYEVDYSDRDPGDSEQISPQDMHAFTCYWQSSNAMDSENACLGFATARVESSDFIYQFAATRVALVIRLSGSSLNIVARALLMPADFTLISSLVSSLKTQQWGPSTQGNDPSDSLILHTVNWQTLDLVRLASRQF